MRLRAQLKGIRENMDLRQEDVALAVGVSRGTITNLENIKKEVNINKDTLGKVAKLYQLDENTLYKEFGYSEIAKSSKLITPINAALETMDLAKSLIPVYTKIAADWMEAIDAIDYVAVTRQRAIPKSWRAYRIKGLCLVPDISEDDTVIVDHALRDYQDGDLVACIKDGNSYVKRYKIKDGKPILVNNFGELTLKDCFVQGIVVQVIKKYR